MKMLYERGLPLITKEQDERRAASPVQNQEPPSKPSGADSIGRGGGRRNPSAMGRWERVIRDIAKDGFLRRSSLSKNLAERLTDPMFVNPPARLCWIGGAISAHRGAVKFSTIHFFGKERRQPSFLVINEEKFNAWVSSRLEAMFRAENPHPDRYLAAAFTRYMHDSNLHWSGCTERSKAKST